jgi:hypothetical protein
MPKLVRKEDCLFLHPFTAEYSFSMEQSGRFE